LQPISLQERVENNKQDRCVPPSQVQWVDQEENNRYDKASQRYKQENEGEQEDLCQDQS